MMRRARAALLFALNVGTATLTGRASAQQAPETCERLILGADEHTCQHGYLGPFGSVGSVSHPGSTPTTNASTTHVLYTVVLSGDPGDNQSAVLFQPTNSGTYSFYMNAEYPLELLDSEGQPLPIRLENDVPSCPEYLGWFQVYEGLVAGQTYTLVLGPVESPFVQVVSERLSAFQDTLYVDGDGDGFGVAEGSVRSWCGVATGYAELSNDCDDDNSDVSPGTPETCNGVDDNCDGEVDETGDALCEEGSSCEGAQGCSAPPDDGCSSSDCGTSSGGASGDEPSSGGCSSQDCDNSQDNPVDPPGGGAGAHPTGGAHSGDGDDSPFAGNAGSVSTPEPEVAPKSGEESAAGCSCRQSAEPRRRLGGLAWLLIAALFWRRSARNHC